MLTLISFFVFTYQLHRKKMLFLVLEHLTVMLG